MSLAHSHDTWGRSTINISDEAQRRYTDNDNDDLFRLVGDHWPSTDEGLPSGIGEACRFAAIRAAAEKDHVRAHLLRARALTAALMTGDRDTAAGLLLPHFFTAIALTLEGANGGDGRGFDAAREILEEMKRLVPRNAASWSRLFARLYHEKRALSFLMEATGGRRPLPGNQSRLEKAEAEYVLALDAARGDRDVLKVRGGVALVRYLRLSDDSTSVMAQGGKPELAETQSVLSSAASAHYLDVEEWATTNAAVMGRGEFDGWVPYDVL